MERSNYFEPSLQLGDLEQELEETENTENTEPHCKNVDKLPVIFQGADIYNK